MNIILIVITIISFLFGLYYRFIYKPDLDENIAKKNQIIKEKNEELRNQQLLIEKELNILISQKELQENSLKDISNQVNIQSSELKVLKTKTAAEKDMINSLHEEHDALQSNLNVFTKNFKENVEAQKELSQKAFSSYCDSLDKLYDEKEKEFDILVNNLDNAYEKKQEDILFKISEVEKELDNIRQTRASAIEAARREKEIKEDVSFYCLSLDVVDQSELVLINKLKEQLTKPRILSMLIWQNYFQKSLKALSTNVLGTSNQVTGIYKITNIDTGECYIGQAVDVAKRWTEHAKCGLGIDTPPQNKLYKAMLEYGLTSFSWELLESCDRQLLDEKERLYIELYDSVSFGYNSQAGNKK